MSAIASVNLTSIKAKIAANSGDVPTQFAHQLRALSRQSDGPVRVRSKIENGVTVKYPGVRSWKNFFLETFFCSAEHRASETIRAVSEIEKTIRPFLQKHNGTSYEHFELIVTGLNCKATGKNLSLPSVGTAADSGGAIKATRPDFKASPDLASTRVKTFYGNTVIPSGITIGKIAVENVIAEFRSITSYHSAKSQCGLHERSKTDRRRETRIADTEMDPAKFKAYYLAQLNKNADQITVSVALELETSSQEVCTKANVQGAHDAAVEFIALMKEKNKEVSVFLSTPTLYADIKRTQNLV